MGTVFDIPSILNMVLGGWGAIENSAQSKEDRKTSIERYNQAMGKLDSLSNILGQPGQGDRQFGLGGSQTSSAPGTGLWGLADSYSKQFGGMSDEAIKKGDALASQQSGKYSELESIINAAFGDRTKQGMSMLQGLGNQERKDLAQDYKNLASQQQSRMISSGLGNTTLSASLLAGTERQKQDDMRRLNDRLNREQFDAYAGLTGDQLNTQGALGMDVLGKQSQLGQWSIDNNYSKQGDALMNSYNLQMTPYNAATDLTKFQTAAMMGYQPPASIPLGTALQASVTQPMLDGIRYDADMRMQNWALKNQTGAAITSGITSPLASFGGAYYGSKR